MATAGDGVNFQSGRLWETRFPDQPVAESGGHAEPGHSVAALSARIIAPRAVFTCAGPAQRSLESLAAAWQSATLQAAGTAAPSHPTNPTTHAALQQKARRGMSEPSRILVTSAEAFSQDWSSMLAEEVSLPSAAVIRHIQIIGITWRLDSREDRPALGDKVLKCSCTCWLQPEWNKRTRMKGGEDDKEGDEWTPP